MKVKTLRSILQTGIVLATVLLLSLAIILIVQFVEIKNLEDKKDELEKEQKPVTLLCDDEESEMELVLDGDAWWIAR